MGCDSRFFPDNSWVALTFLEYKHHVLISFLGNSVVPTPPSQVGCGKRESKEKEKKKERKGMEEDRCIYSEMGVWE